jgi:hypothetical protein
MKKLWCPEAAVFLFCWLLLLLAGRERFFADPGSLWHITVGEKNLHDGQLVRTDPFSFTRNGQAWLAQWWLAECVLALLHRVGGLDAVAVAAVTLMASLLTWLYHRCLRAGMHPLLGLLVIALVMMGTLYNFHPRPSLITTLGVAWTCACLVDFEAGRTSLLRLFGLVPLFVLWANMHGGMAGGVLCLALAGLGWSVTPFINGPAPLQGRQYLVYAGLVALCVLAAFVNPYGAALPRVWFALMTSAVLPRLIQEHGPLWTAGNAAWIVGFQAAIYLGCVLSVPVVRWRVTWLLPLVFLVLTWTRVRYGPIFTVSMAVALADAYPDFRWTGWLARKGSVLFRPRPAVGRPGLLALLPPALLVATSFVLQAAAVCVPVIGAGWVRLDQTELPVGLLPPLREYERCHPDGTPLFNDMLFGGFLIYYTPGLRVFIDDRCELYGDDGLLEYAHAYFEDPGQIDRWQEQYHFDAALVRTGSGIDLYLRQHPDRWTPVGQTPAATFFRRTGT